MGARPKPLSLCGVAAYAAVLCALWTAPAAARGEPESTDEAEGSAGQAQATKDQQVQAEAVNPAQALKGGVASPAGYGKNAAPAVPQIAIGIGPNDLFHFGADSGGSDDGSADEVLFQTGKAKNRFTCGEGGSLAVERSNVAVRRLGIWQAAEESFMGNMGFGGAGDGEWPDLWVTDGQLRVFSEDGQTQGSSVLIAALESPLPNGTKIQAGTEADHATGLAVQYDCRQEGSAIVELRLRSESSKGPKEAICMRWIKVCTVGWGNLMIEQGGNMVLDDGVLQADWTSRMAETGTQQAVLKFVLSSEGIEQIRRPTATSNQKLLSVELLGPLVMGEKSEVSKEPITLTVMFICVFDGFADVTLTIEKDTFSGEEPERMKIKFRKVCGTSPYQHLEINIKSEKYKNRTKAVEGGAVLPGFARPCKGAEAQALSQSRQHHQDLGEHCDNNPPILMVSEKELRTVLELDIDKFGLADPPTFHPQADVTYDNRVLRVAVLQAPFMSPTVSGQRKHNQRSKRQTLTLKYTCYKNEESIVMVTLHVLSYKSIYLAWRKKCVEPKAKVGKALTAPQAIMVTMFICGIIVLCACLVFAYCGGQKETLEEPQKRLGYSKASRRDRDDDSGGELELPGKVIGSRAPQEVVYHS